MAKQITDNASKSPVAQEDILLVRDVTSNTDKKTTIAGVAPAVAANLPLASVSSTKINFGGGGAGLWWEEIGRTTLTSPGDVISVAGLPARKFLAIRFMVFTTSGQQVSVVMNFNNDGATNYAYRVADSGSPSESNNLNATGLFYTGPAALNSYFAEAEIVNLPNYEKTILSRGAINVGNSATNNIVRITNYGKWANITAQINRIDLTNLGTGDYATGSELVVLGHN
ncbi:hypothetical protein F6X56_15220 [Rhodococcus erythropolis]|uniref:hypothetical protein n=1 Tax=Rhodococcus erythropolis TaxID=1833 RepID=UPI001247531D|nr:hypothetical protein [Rhodococcus erythropolis]QEX10973.1 hypothetical protein F6X56_15220 [Rhodococcus erythropolis]